MSRACKASPLQRTGELAVYVSVRRCLVVAAAAEEHTDRVRLAGLHTLVTWRRVHMR